MKEMPLNNGLFERAFEQFNSAQRILLACHLRPDGDAIGSLLGLGLALSSRGKQVQMVCDDGVPSSCRYLEGSSEIRRHAEGDFDLVCVVDCSDLERAGAVLQSRAKVEINIDHHPTNLGFADLNLVDVQAVATAEIITDLLSQWEVTITPPIATALLTGLVTDTIGFRTSNVKPATLRMAADLMECGADLAMLYRRALLDHSFQAMRFWGAGLTRLERNGRLLWTSLTLDDRKAARYPGRDDADLINILSTVEDADVAVIFVEQPNERVKVSWRAQPGFDVSGIAVNLGGGGHTAAAGAEIQGSLQEVQARILELTRSLLNGGQQHV
jgi:bifunctional oligoribonuclease and PAP phosphatase NrnA